MYRILDATEIIETVDRLRRRIGERFPTSGLLAVCGEICSIAREASDRASKLTRPNIRLRIALIAMLALGAGCILLLVYVFARSFNISVQWEFSNIAQGIEAIISILIFAGLGFAYLRNLERRMKRRTALQALHELRSVIHVVDMHQLTKDPTFVFHQGLRTLHSPRHGLGPFELTRYLDYCSEMLALTGKVAALYAQDFDDDVTVQAVNDIEMLAANLSRKIWQKIALLQAIVGSGKSTWGNDP